MSLETPGATRSVSAHPGQRVEWDKAGQCNRLHVFRRRQGCQGPTEQMSPKCPPLWERVVVGRGSQRWRCLILVDMRDGKCRAKGTPSSVGNGAFFHLFAYMLEALVVREN